MREPGLARQTTCRGDGEKLATRFLGTGRLAPASYLKVSGSLAPTPPRSPDVVTDPANVGSTRPRSSIRLRYGSIRANNATENAVPLPPQKKMSGEFLRATSYRSLLFVLRLSSARLTRNRLRSRFAAGNRQNSFDG